MIGPSIIATFGGDTSGLNKASTEGLGIVQKFASSASALMSTMGMALGAGAIASFFATIIEKGGALQDLSDRLGVGTDELQSFDFAVRQAGGTSEQANQTWDKSRKALDNLASGQDTAVKQFAALGLKASDFIGLDLPASLEKISRGYAANIEGAGAYDAVTDILGTRTAPALNAVLLKLGAEGFPAFVKGAKDAGQVIDKEAIARMDEFGDRVESLKGTLTTWGAKAFNVFGQIGEGIGILVAGMANKFDGIKTAINETDWVAQKVNTTITKILPPMKELEETAKRQKEIAAERGKLEEFITKTTMAQLEPQQRLSELHRQIAVHSAALAAAGSDELKQLKEKRTIAELNAEYTKLAAAEQKKTNDATRLGKEDELELVRLTIKATSGLTSEERVRFDILKLQQAQLKNQYEIKLILSKGTENLTTEDKANLSVLFAQGQNLESQISHKKALIEKTNELAAAEGNVTKEIEKQWSIEVQQIRGKSNQDLSDRELQEKINTLKDQLDKDKLSDPFGKYAYLSSQQRADLGKAESEAARRASFRQAYSQQGEAALNQYSAFDEQTLRNYIRPEDEKRAQQNAENIADIARRLGRIF